MILQSFKELGVRYRFDLDDKGGAEVFIVMVNEARSLFVFESENDSEFFTHVVPRYLAWLIFVGSLLKLNFSSLERFEALRDSVSLVSVVNEVFFVNQEEARFLQA